MAGESANTLKLHDTEPVLPGLALPEAFESLDRRIESTIKLCKLSTPPDTHVLSVIGMCQELQRLLKCTFIENGILASRLEILVKYQEESLRKMGKRIASFDLEQKMTKKHMKRLRKRVTAHDMYQKKKRENWWNVSVRTSDYESFSMLSRTTGSPDLEFVLRINQLMIDFVADQERTELLLPPMGQDERGEVSKLASIYKIRCRYGKATQVASSTLIKARQTCIPGHGEVDAILDGFARAQNLKRLFGGIEETVLEEGKSEAASQGEVVLAKGKSQSPPVSSIPSTMLTPLSSLTSASIDMSGSACLTPVPSPPASGLSMPTGEHLLVKCRRDSHDRSSSKSRSRCGSQSSANENPLPVPAPRPNLGGSMGGALGGVTSNTPHLTKMPAPLNVLGGVPLAGGGGGVMPTVGSLASLGLPPHAKLSMASAPQRISHQPHPSVLAGGHLAQTSGTLMGSMILQQQQHLQHLGAAMRPHSQSTVVASPLKIPVSQLPHSVQHNLTSWGVAGGVVAGEPGRLGTGSVGSAEARVGVAESVHGVSGEGEEGRVAKEGSGVTPPTSDASPPKRTRLSRKAAAGMSNPEESVN